MPKWSLRTCFLPYDKNEDSKMLNIPLYMLFVLGKELETESKNLKMLKKQAFSNIPPKNV